MPDNVYVPASSQDEVDQVINVAQTFVNAAASERDEANRRADHAVHNMHSEAEQVRKPSNEEKNYLMYLAEQIYAKKNVDFQEEVRRLRERDELTVIQGVQELKEQHEQEKARMREETNKEKAVNNRKMEFMQERMEKVIAQQEENNKVMTEMRNVPVATNVQTSAPSTPLFGCPNCVPVRLPPDMQNPDFHCPGCVPRNPGFGEDIPKNKTVFYDIDSPVKSDVDDFKAPKPSVQAACSGSDSRNATPGEKKKPNPRGEWFISGTRLPLECIKNQSQK